MSFSEFIRACDQTPSVQVTHALCVSADAILASYVKYPYRMDTPKLFYSMTKTVSSLAIGIAEDLGLLSVEDPVIKFFEELRPAQPDPHLDEITIRHLLTMSCGIHDDTYPQLFVQDNWPRAFLAQTFPHAPGTHFLYCTHGSHMLSAIITKVSGLSLEDFVNRYLFHPMGIYEARWEHAPEGLVAGGMGLSLCPMSLVKIAQLFLNRGVHQGQRLISTRYLDMATTQQIVKQDHVNDPQWDYFGSGYGFQIHVGKHGYYRMEGSFGQVCLVAPDKGLAVVVFSQNVDFEMLLSLIYRHVLDGSAPCGTLTAGEPSPACIPAVSVPLGVYEAEENLLGLERVELRAAGEDFEAVLTGKTCENIIRFSSRGDTGGKMTFIKDLEEHLQEYVCQTAWDPILKLTVFLIETPYVASYAFRPEGEDLVIDFTINVSFTLHDCSIRAKRIA